MDGYELLLNKHTKCVYLDAGHECVVRGVFKSHDAHTVIIIGDRDGKPVVVGKGVLVSLKEDYQNRRDP